MNQSTEKGFSLSRRHIRTNQEQSVNFPPILTGPPSWTQTADDAADPAQHEEERQTEFAAPRVEHEDAGDGSWDLNQLHQDEVDVDAAAQHGGVHAEPVVDHGCDEPVDEDDEDGDGGGDDDEDRYGPSDVCRGSDLVDWCHSLTTNKVIYISLGVPAPPPPPILGSLSPFWAEPPPPQ